MLFVSSDPTLSSAKTSSLYRLLRTSASSKRCARVCVWPCGLRLRAHRVCLRAQIEDRILEMLANSSGDILDDEGLINNLGASKTTSESVGSRMREAESTSKEIDETRELYRPVVRLCDCLLRVAPSESGACAHWLVCTGNPRQHPILCDC
jgi:hypothetical protein